MLGKLGCQGVRERGTSGGAGAGAGALHAVRVVAVGGAVGQAAARRRRVRVAARAAQVAAALAAVRVAARPAAGAALHRAAVGAALRQRAARAARALARALVRVRVLLLGAARPHGVAVHHHVVTRRLQQPRPIATADHTSPPTLAPTRPTSLLAKATHDRETTPVSTTRSCCKRHGGAPRAAADHATVPAARPCGRAACPVGLLRRRARDVPQPLARVRVFCRAATCTAQAAPAWTPASAGCSAE